MSENECQLHKAEKECHGLHIFLGGGNKYVWNPKTPGSSLVEQSRQLVQRPKTLATIEGDHVLSKRIRADRTPYPFQNHSHVLWKNYLDFDRFVPRTGLRSYEG